jgi:hypothetical protein
MNLTPERRAQLEDLRDRYRAASALFLEVAETLRRELHRRGYTDEQIDNELRTRPRRRKGTK